MPTAAPKALRQAQPRTTAKAKAQKPAARKPAARKAAPRKAAATKARRPAPTLDTGIPDAPHTADGVTLYRVDHLTIRAHPQHMDALRDFYAATLGLKPGKRPNFTFPGYWLYMGKRAVIHLAASAKPDAPQMPSGTAIGFDHVSFRTSGLQAARERLRKLNVPFDEVPVPGFPLHQIFFRDPVGMKVELTFDGAELERAGQKG